MFDEDNEVEDGLVSQLRDGLEGGEATAVLAPNLSVKDRVRTRFGGLSRLKPFIVRGLLIVMLLVIVGQLAYQSAAAANRFDGGPVPIYNAVDQLGDDLPPLPLAP